MAPHKAEKTAHHDCPVPLVYACRNATVAPARGASVTAAVDISLKLLGPLTVSRAGAAVALPASRKVRAMIGYLALAERPYSRAHLCELLWDVPNDPRGELRWCLSKIRGLIDDPDCARIRTSGERVALDLDGCSVDVLEIEKAIQEGLTALSPQRLQELLALFGGEVLDGLELDRNPQFNGWLVAQRRRFRACHAAILERLAQTLPPGGGERFAVLEHWLELAPLDRRAHAMLFDAFAHEGRTREGAEHLEAATRVFEGEALDPAPLRAAWAAAVKAKQGASLQTSVVVTPAQIASVATPSPRRRASIAVMPLADLSLHTQDRLGGLANALAHDLITRLAKLRSLSVIAQGTMFVLGERGVGPGAAGRMLDVDYVASGSVRRHQQRVTVMIELVETRTAHIVWAEDFDYALDDALLVLEEIGNRIVAAIASEIELEERKRALLKPPESLDAWEAYHRGLWHMYRFEAGDNDRAQHFFEMAVRLDPTFSRAHAGLSFTHFQNAFLHRIGDREREMERAFATASQGLIADERDPAAHWAMGRALWLHGRQDECLSSLDRAVELSPNFASGHYTLAFVHSQSGDPRAAITSADHSRHLSPFDPLLFAMMASRALALVRLGEVAAGADWAVSAAARPNAHVHVRAIAAHCLAAASRLDDAQRLVASIHKTHPSYGIQDFLTAFRFDPDSAALFKGYARRIGIG
jgi:DNA-binding SARP family transcriptional activator